MANKDNQPTVSATDDQGNEIPHTDNSPKQEPKQGGMTITFRDMGGGEVSFKLKPTTKLKKAMDAYSARAERERRTLRFLFEGQRVLDASTPENLGMEDGDSVDVHTEQVGGGGE